MFTSHSGKIIERDFLKGAKATNNKPMLSSWVLPPFPTANNSEGHFPTQPASWLVLPRLLSTGRRVGLRGPRAGP